MGYELVSDSGAETGFNLFSWAIARRLAEDFGWQPRGTLPPEGWDAEVEKIGEWDGRYTSNDGQFVTAEDALALGASLEAALASDVFETRIRSLYAGAVAQIRSGGVSVADPESDAPAWRSSFAEFVHFCRQGGFRIL
jgi:hypothetical protein